MSFGIPCIMTSLSFAFIATVFYGAFRPVLGYGGGGGGVCVVCVLTHECVLVS